MNKKRFRFAVLKYRPSFVLDERANVGLLCLFPDDGLAEFVFPPQLARLGGLFPGTDLGLVRDYLRGFQARARQLSKKNLFLEIDQNRLIEQEFLVADANALFFSDWKEGFFEGEPQVVAQRLRAEYFAFYGEATDAGRHDDDHLKRQFSQQFRQISTEKWRLLAENRRIENARSEAEFAFAWQNGTLNYVGPISFDLKQPESITRKSDLWFGRLTHLRPELEKRRARVDFLIAEPQSPEKAVQKAFEKALASLGAVEAEHRFIRENELSSYVAEAAATIQPLLF